MSVTEWNSIYVGIRNVDFTSYTCSVLNHFNDVYYAALSLDYSPLVSFSLFFIRTIAVHASMLIVTIELMTFIHNTTCTFALLL